MDSLKNIDLNNIDLNNIDLSKLKVNTKGYESVQLSDEHEAMIKKVGNFIDDARKSNALNCDAECKRNQKETLLYNDYLQAKQTAENAPQILEDSERNFYEFSKGGAWFQNMKRGETDKSAQKLVNLLKRDYVNNYEKFAQLLQQYSTQHIYSNNMEEVERTYENKLTNVERKEKDKKSNAAINNRKSFYDSQKTEMYDFFISIVKSIYYLIVAIYAVIMLLIHGEYKNKTIWGILIAMVLYPYVAYFLFEQVKSAYQAVF